MPVGRLSAVGLAMSVALALAGPASGDTLSGKELRILLAGKTIHISAPFGTVPVRYSAGGTMSAKSKAMGVYAGVAEDRGTWRISGNQFCQRWNIWKKGQEQCFSVSLTGSKVRWQSDDGSSGTAYAAK